MKYSMLQISHVLYRRRNIYFNFPLNAQLSLEKWRCGIMGRKLALWPILTQRCIYRVFTICLQVVYKGGSQLVLLQNPNFIMDMKTQNSFKTVYPTKVNKNIHKKKQQK